MDSFINLIKKYKWLTVPLIPLVLFFVLILFLFLSPPEQQTQNITPTPSPKTLTEMEAVQPTLALLNEQGYDVEIDDPLDQGEDFQKKEPADGTFPDGTIVYTYTSTNPERPNLITTQGEQVILLQRNVTDPDAPVVITDYTDVDGQPDKIVQGSRFYGPDKQIYIYASLGVAFIADPATQQVLEQHLFLPMNAEDYLKKFGQQ